LRRLSADLARYYRQKGDEAEELYHLIAADPPLALTRFRDAFDRAEAAYDLARCDDLLGLFDRPALAPELAEARNDRKTRLETRGLWIDDYYRTARYIDRPLLAGALATVLGVDDPWVLQLHAPGGLGKTQFLCWMAARYCADRHIPCARIDF